MIDSSQPLETPIILYCFCRFCPHPPLVSSGSLQIFSYPFFKRHKLEHDLEFLHSAGDGAQDLVHARRALYLYRLSYILAPSYLFDVVTVAATTCHCHCLLPVLPSPPTPSTIKITDKQTSPKVFYVAQCHKNHRAAEKGVSWLTQKSKPNRLVIKSEKEYDMQMKEYFL